MMHQDFAAELVGEIPRLRRFARGLVGDAALADDLVQDCVERALVKQHLYDRARPLRAWLFAILRNIHVSQWRRSQHLGPLAELTEMDEPAVAPEQEQAMSVALITEALDLLPQMQREVLILISLEEMSYKEAAEIMAVPIGTVMSRLSRARNALQALLEKRGTTVLRVVK